MKFNDLVPQTFLHKSLALSSSDIISWEELNGDNSYQEKNHWEGKYYFSDAPTKSYLIVDSLFSQLFPKGAIRFLNTKPTMSIFINISVFQYSYSTASSHNGGAFYWRPEGNVAIYGSCFDTAYAGYSGQAYGITVSNSTSAIDHCNMTSYFNIGQSPTKGYFLATHALGHIILFNNNMTECRSSDQAAYRPGTEASEAIIQHCIFQNISSGRRLFTDSLSVTSNPLKFIFDIIMYCEISDNYVAIDSNLYSLSLTSCIVKNNKITKFCKSRATAVITDTYLQAGMIISPDPKIESPRVDDSLFALELIHDAFCKRKFIFIDSNGFQKVCRKSIFKAFAQIPALISQNEGTHI